MFDRVLNTPLHLRETLKEQNLKFEFYTWNFRGTPQKQSPKCILCKTFSEQFCKCHRKAPAMKCEQTFE